MLGWLGNNIRLALWAGALLAAWSSPAVAAPLADPAAAGMERLDGRIFVDPDLPAENRAQISALVRNARLRVAYFYGSLKADPNLVFCASQYCYRRFGGVGLGFTDGAHIVISPLGLRAAIIAHELAHVELASRIGGFSQVLANTPQWFDEGQAVMISMAEEFSEEAWLDSTRQGEDAPSLDALRDLAEWNRLTGRDGENMQLTYGTAKRELVRWFSKVGRGGFTELLAALGQGQSFEGAYRHVERRYASPVFSAQR